MVDFESVFEAELDAVPDEQFDRDRFVASVGSFDADVMVIGEAPGAQEVKQGEPFVGQAGKQLDRILESVGVDRGKVYITNLVKVRPPENRDPHRATIDAWWPVLKAEIEEVDPAVIVTLGNFASQELLDTNDSMADMHGQTFEVEGRPVVPTYHPAATFYDRSKVETIEADFETALALV